MSYNFIAFIASGPTGSVFDFFSCMFFYMVPLSACAWSPLQEKWENQILIMPASFNTVLSNQNNHAQSFLANFNVLLRNDRRQYDFVGFPHHSRPFFV